MKENGYIPNKNANICEWIFGRLFYKYWYLFFSDTLAFIFLSAHDIHLAYSVPHKDERSMHLS
jgi:hypothetical protein